MRTTIHFDRDVHQRGDLGQPRPVPVRGEGFARDDAHFAAMLREMWRVLRAGGLLFCRLASDIGMESRMQPLGDGRYRLPDGSERYLVNQAMLLDWTQQLGGRLLDPLKTTVVQDQRCMTTWVVEKLSN